MVVLLPGTPLAAVGREVRRAHPQPRGAGQDGGRFMADFTDSDKEQVKVGAKMRMTFRIRDNDQMRGGFKRYFWKATPV